MVEISEDSVSNAIAELVEKIAGEVLELPPIERAPAVHDTISKLRETYREHYVGDRQALARAMRFSVLLEEAVERRIGQA